MVAYVGIDVSQDELEVCVIVDNSAAVTNTIKNHRTGINKLKRWLRKQGAKEVHVCLEATSWYSELAAEMLYETGFMVSVVNPKQIKAYGDVKMRRTKTDKLDAALIADFCRTQTPEAWTPPPPEVKELRHISRHLASLKEEAQRARNRLSAQQDKSAQAHLRAQIKLFDQQIKATEKRIKVHIDNHPKLKRNRDLLKSIPGIGHLTASVLLAELGDISRFNDVREVVAYVGLNPQQKQSGHSNYVSGISKMGRPQLRAALYMPALVAVKHNPNLAVFYDRLIKTGLKPKQAVVAVMRKLLHLAYGILKSGKPFDINYGQKLKIAT